MEYVKFRIGDIVRPSGYVLRPLRDYWNNCGTQPAKDRAKDALDNAIAHRGTVTGIPKPGSVEVTTVTGAVHRSLDHRWDTV